MGPQQPTLADVANLLEMWEGWAHPTMVHGISSQKGCLQRKEVGDHNPSSAHMVADEPGVYARAMIAKALNVNKPEVYVGMVKEPEVYVRAITTETLSIDGPQRHTWILWLLKPLMRMPYQLRMTMLIGSLGSSTLDAAPTSA